MSDKIYAFLGEAIAVAVMAFLLVAAICLSLMMVWSTMQYILP